MPQQTEITEREIDIARIHPDPFQPRVHPDAELAESIKAQGILQAILVEVIDGSNSAERICPECGKLFVELEAEGGHFMIQDGERRYQGSVAAGRKTLLCKIVEPATEAERLLRQLTANTGKPLTPVEDAFALKRLLDATGWNQAELARQLGRPRSLIGDRIRLVELDPVWLDLIASGRLQVSHAPTIATFSEVPADYQKKAAGNLLSDYRAKRFLDEGDKIPVDEMRHLLYVAFRDYIKPLSDVPGYKGPVITIQGRFYGGGRAEKYAADIAIWRPIFNKRQNKRRREMQKNAGSSFTSSRKRDKTVEELEQLPKRKTSEYQPNAHKGEVLVYEQDSGFRLDGIPDVFLAKVDPSKLTRVFAQNSAAIVTTDLAAVKAATDALDAQLKKKLEGKLTEIRGVMRSKKMEEFQVSGPGCRYLLSTAEKYGSPLPVIALAMGLPNPGIDTEDDYEDDAQQASTLAAGYLAYRAGILKVPAINAAKDAILWKLRHTPFKLPKISAPARPKKVDAGEMRAAVEAGTVDEDEEVLEGAGV